MSTASEQLALPGMVADPAEDSDQLTVFDALEVTA